MSRYNESKSDRQRNLEGLSTWIPLLGSRRLPLRSRISIYKALLLEFESCPMVNFFVYVQDCFKN